MNYLILAAILIAISSVAGVLVYFWKMNKLTKKKLLAAGAAIITIIASALVLLGPLGDEYFFPQSNNLPAIEYFWFGNNTSCANKVDLGKYGPHCSNFTCNNDGVLDNLTACLQFYTDSPATNSYIQGAIYYAGNLSLVATTDITMVGPSHSTQWVVLEFSSPPDVYSSTEYLLAIDSNASDTNVYIRYWPVSHWSARKAGSVNEIDLADPWVTSTAYTEREYCIYASGHNGTAETLSVDIRNNGVDYFIWLGDNGTASDVASVIADFDEASEYISVWEAGTWNEEADGGWIHYYGDSSGTDFSVSTFDVIKVYLTDSGTQTLVMTKNPMVDYDAQRTVYVHNLTKNKGYNYTGYTNSSSTTLGQINGTKITLSPGSHISVWNRTTFEWVTFISYFGMNADEPVGQWDVIETKVQQTRSFII